MLTTGTSTLNATGHNHAHLPESGPGHVQAFGPGQVHYHPPRPGTGPVPGSAATGGCHTEPETIAGIQTWNAEDHYPAIFPTEQAMRTGARHLAHAWGDQLPTGIHRVIA